MDTYHWSESDRLESAKSYLSSELEKHSVVLKDLTGTCEVATRMHRVITIVDLTCVMELNGTKIVVSDFALDGKALEIECTPGVESEKREEIESVLTPVFNSLKDHLVKSQTVSERPRKKGIRITLSWSLPSELKKKAFTDEAFMRYASGAREGDRYILYGGEVEYKIVKEAHGHLSLSWKRRDWKAGCLVALTFNEESVAWSIEEFPCTEDELKGFWERCYWRPLLGREFNVEAYESQ